MVRSKRCDCNDRCDNRLAGHGQGDDAQHQRPDEDDNSARLLVPLLQLSFDCHDLIPLVIKSSKPRPCAPLEPRSS